MASKQLELPIFHYDDPATGSPLVGGLVYTYAAGTSTAQTTYTDSTLTVANANPVVLDAYGNAKIWFDQSLKVIVRSADGLTTYFTEDNISPVGGTSIVFGNFNAILNGDFESDTSGAPDNWTLSAYSGGTIAVDTTAAVSGNQSLKFTGTGTGGGTATSTIFDVQASTDILVEFSYKASAAASTNVVQVFWYQLDGTASATISTTVHTDSATNPASFTRYVYSVDVPSDATQARLVITGVSSGGGQLSSNATFDNVRVITEPYLVPDTLGTVEANKVVTADSNLDTTGFRNVTATGTVAAGSFSTTGALASGDHTITDTSPQLIFIETGAAADNTRWDILVDAESLSHRVVNDANNLATNYMVVQRTGTTVDSVTFSQPTTITTATITTLTATTGDIAAGQIAPSATDGNSYYRARIYGSDVLQTTSTSYPTIDLYQTSAGSLRLGTALVTGQFRVYYSRLVTNASYSCDVRICLNGVSVATSSTSSTSYVETFHTITVTLGDVITLQVKTTNATATASVTNVFITAGSWGMVLA